MDAPRFLLLAAMTEEREPFLAAADRVGPEQPGPTRVARFTPIVWQGMPGGVLLTGIGTVNAAAALSGWLMGNRAPELIVSVGSAGGLSPQVSVGDVVIGTGYRYADVDARAFGYELGQVPRMPAVYPGPELGSVDGEYARPGLLLTSSSFVTAELAAPMRENFPDALAVDMESAALAQVCHLYGQGDFVAIRGISDLCTPRAGEEFTDGLGLAAARSFEMTRTLLTRL